jgi:hypothetical protein
MSKPRKFEDIGDHYDTTKVAVRLDMSVRWVKEQVKRQNLVGFKLGKKLVISGDSIRAYLEKCKTTIPS